MRKYGLSRNSLVRNLLLAAILILSMILSASLNTFPTSAVQWSSVNKVPTTTTANFKPNVSQDNQSDIWLAYESTVTQQSYYEVRYQYTTTTAWSSPFNITSPKGFNTGPSIQVLANQTIFIAWTSNRTGFQELWYRTGVRTLTAISWSTDKQLTHDNLVAPNGPDASAVIEDLTGNIWVFYQRVVLSTSNIFYNMFKPGTGWTGETQLTFDTVDILPGATVTSDGRVWVTFALFSSGTYNIWYKIFSGTWSLSTRLTTSKLDDQGPDIVQARDGTLWAFWSREIPVQPSAGIFGADIFYKNSTNMGLTWSADTQLTTSGSSATGCVIIPCFNFSPALLQLGANLYVFWGSDMPDASNYNIFYQFTPILFHDLAVTRISFTPSMTYPLSLKFAGVKPQFNVSTTIANLGSFTDTAQLTIYANSTLIGGGSFVLAPGQTFIVQTTWNVTNLKPSNNFIKAIIAPVPGEINAPNDVLTSSCLRILPLGDIDQDGGVTIIDFSVAAYGYLQPVGSPRYNAYADINSDGVIDILDLAVVAATYNTILPSC